MAEFRFPAKSYNEWAIAAREILEFEALKFITFLCNDVAVGKEKYMIFTFLCN